MKRSSYTKSILQGILLILLMSCDSTFIMDPIDPRLPIYSENGYNVAGAFVNEVLWKSARYHEYVNIDSWGAFEDSLVYRQMPTIVAMEENDSLIITFDGKISNERSLIIFRLSGFPIDHPDDLPSLEGQKIALDGLTNMGIFTREDSITGNVKEYLSKGVGQLYIKNASFIDSIETATLSGTFGFKVNNSAKQTMEISYGRFDFTFKEKQNFSIKKEAQP